MKFAVGSTYKEAIVNRPLVGISRFDEEAINHIRSSYNVVLLYKNCINNSVYSWKAKGPFCYYVYNKQINRPVCNKDSSKILYFKSIHKATEWIYKHDKEFYNSQPNLSIKEEIENGNEHQ